MIFRSLRLALPVVIFGSAAALVAPGSFGYALEKVFWPSGSVITMQMEMGPLDQSLQDGSSSWNGAIVPAIDTWNTAMANVQFVTVLESTKPISSGDGINSTSFASTVFGDSFGSGVLAVTYYRTQGGAITEADVLFNKAQTFDSYRGILQFNSQGKCICDIQRVYLHELGHALGLGHPDAATPKQNVEAVMNSIASNRSLLSSDDLAGIHFLYGTASPTPTPGPSATPGPTPEPPSRLVNISTRMRVGIGPEVLIGGFIIQGDVQKKVILRAIGPSLGAAGVAGALQNPQIELRDGAGALLGSNDDWQESLDAGEIVASTLAPSDPKEAAIIARLAPGNYTVVVSGVNNSSGVGLVESYTLDAGSAHAGNISTRGRVGTGDEVLIGGFIVGGKTSKSIIIRALGPSLGLSGIDGALANPLIELHDSDGQLVALNDDWQNSPQAAEITAAGFMPNDSREAALIATLPPGGYTALVRGADGGEGIGLVEIYDLDP
ncbi:MAG: matrixin family metalloprotease [Spartobacteria bacterium]